MNPNSKLLPIDKMTPGTLKRLGKLYGFKNEFEMVPLAASEGARLGRGESNQQTKAAQYFIKKYNSQLTDIKERTQAAEERREFLRKEKLREEREAAAKKRKKARDKARREAKKSKKRKFTIKLIDQINKFRKYLVTFDPRAESIKEFYEIWDSISRDVFQGDVINISLYFHQDEGVATRSISANDLTTYEDFAARLQEIVKGGSKKYGSDAIEGGEAMLIPNKFLVQTYSTSVQAFGSSENILFKSRGVDGKKKLCAWECLKALGYAEKLREVDMRLLSNIEYLKKTILKYHLPIVIISNVFQCKDTWRDMKAETRRANVKERLKIMKPLTISNIEVRKIFDPRCDGPIIVDDSRVNKIEHYLVYDENKEHIDICEMDGREFQLKDGVEIDACLNIYLDEKEIYKASMVNKITKNKEFVTTQYVFFDYETIVDFEHHNCMKEYSLSILSLNEEDLAALDQADKTGDVRTVNEVRKLCCTTFLGHDCSQQFIKWILENQQHRAFVFIGFNNVVFDNFFLLDALLRNAGKFKNEYDVSQIFYNGSQLMNFLINGRHTTFDIHKHLVGSLASNCKSFQINCCSKKTFDHAKAQELYDEGKLIDFINTSPELKEYNEFDVLATAVLYARYSNALKEIECTSEYGTNLYKYKTIGSLIYNVFEDHTLAAKISLPTIPWKWYKELQRCKVAGRVEMFNGVTELFERIASTDVCSLYPFVMAVLNVYYPAGDKIIEVDSYQGDDTLGFYFCDFDQSNLMAKNLPNIYPLKTGIENKWDHEGLIENYCISNVMIGLLKEYGCKVVIRNGFVFPSKVKSCEMFKFQLDIMKAKNLQDKLKDSRDPVEAAQYNSALRDTLKLLINSLSGKVIESLHTEKVEDISCAVDFQKIKEKAVSINVINNIGSRVFVSYTVGEEDICERQQRPIYLGCLLYDYAKRYMYQMSYSKIGRDKLLYTDTDASKFPYTEMPRWREWIERENIVVPHWKEVEEYDPRFKTHLIYQPGSKVFGSFEDELEDMVGENYTFYCLQKKSWLYAVDGKVKYRFKGLSDGAIPLDLTEKFLGRKMIGDGNAGKIEKIFIPSNAKNQLLTAKYLTDNKIKCLGASSESPKFKLYTKEEKLAHSQIQLKFYRDLYHGIPTHVLCTSFRKIVKNSMRGVGMDDTLKFNRIMNRLQLCQMIKKIQIIR